MEKNIVSIIPARGGSQGIPQKNIIDFCGKPLIAWSILQAMAAKKVSSVWVTSDSDDILAVAEQYGANPIKRPDELSGPTASSESAWLHAVDYIEQEDMAIDIVMAMQATSPIREAEDLDNSITSFEAGIYDSMLSVNEIEDFFIWERQEHGGAKAVNYDYRDRKPRQKIEKRLLENGSFYLFKPELLKRHNNRLGGNIGFYELDRYKMFQIDNPQDLKLCAAIMRAYGLDKS